MAGKAGLQKSTTLLETLPPLKVIDADTLGYYVRYRVVSEDRNKTSHWSPVYVLTPPYEFRRPSGIPLNGIKFFETNTGGSNKVVTLAWDTVDVYNLDNPVDVPVSKALGYDIWIKWGSGSWKFEGRQTAPSLTISVPTPNPGTLSIEVYARSIDISRDSDHQQLLLYKRDNMAV
jgi:hypothetical protein